MMLEYSWQILCVTGIILFVLEMLLGGFFMIPIASAAIITAALTPFLGSWTQILFTLTVFSLILTFFFQFFLKPKFLKNSISTNTDALIGKEIIVTQTIEIGKTGYVKIYADELRARSELSEKIEKGSTVIVKSLSGNTVSVIKK